MTQNIDALIDFAAASGAINNSSTGLQQISRNSAVPLSVCAVEDVIPAERRSTWTAEEEAFLRENIGRLSHAEIGAAIGRTEHAIHVHMVRHGFPPASKRPGWMTGHQVSKLFRVDIHSVMAWHERGIMDFELIPGPRQIRNIKIAKVYRWAVKWQNWIYFKVERIRDPHLRRLVMLAQERWGDEWWTIGQVAAYHGVVSNVINARIRRGSLPGKQWGNWYVRRSDALALKIRAGRGSATYLYGGWTPGADAWILRAHDELGMTFRDIAPRMKGRWDEKRVGYRYHQLKKEANRE